MEKFTEIEGEEWRPVVGYEGLYEVSNLGRVKSLKYSFYRSANSYRCGAMIHRDEFIRKQSPVRHNYKMVNLNGSGKSAKVQVHRLVAQAFIPNPENKPCVNHINCIPSDNRLENLEWCTHKENSGHMVSLDRVSRFPGVKNPSAKLSEEEVLKIKSLIGLFTINELAKDFNVSRITISRIRDCQRWKHLLKAS